MRIAHRLEYTSNNTQLARTQQEEEEEHHQQQQQHVMKATLVEPARKRDIGITTQEIHLSLTETRVQGPLKFLRQPPNAGAAALPCACLRCRFTWGETGDVVRVCGGHGRRVVKEQLWCAHVSQVVLRSFVCGRAHSCLRACLRVWHRIMNACILCSTA